VTNFTAPNYLQDGARTVAEQKLAFEQNLQATKELLGGLPVTSITMSGTSITPAAGVSPFLSVATPGGAASANLANCVPTNMKNGTWMALRMANAGQVVVIKHAAGGAGQFSLAGNADLSLADPTVVLLVALSGTVWEEVGRFYGTQVTAAKNFYQVAGLGQNRFTGRQEWAKGANLASASTLVLGTDGNLFHVTGTTPILALSSAPAGTVVTLVFDGELRLAHDAALLIMLGGHDHYTVAGDVFVFESEATGSWRHVAGPRLPKTQQQLVLHADEFLPRPGGVILGYDYLVDAATYGLTPAGLLRITGQYFVAGLAAGHYANLFGPYDAVNALGLGLFGLGARATAAIRFARYSTDAMAGAIGFHDSPHSINPSNGLWVACSFFAAGAGNFQLAFGKAGAVTVIDSGVPVDNALHTVVWVTAALGVAVYFDNVFKAYVTNPTYLTAAENLSFGCATGAFSPAGWELDYWRVRYGGL
jgi:hypothetical protein